LQVLASYRDSARPSSSSQSFDRSKLTLAAVWAPARYHDVSLVRSRTTSPVRIAVNSGSDEMQSGLSTVRVDIIVLFEIAHGDDIPQAWAE